MSTTYVSMPVVFIMVNWIQQKYILITFLYSFYQNLTNLVLFKLSYHLVIKLLSGVRCQISPFKGIFLEFVFVCFMGVGEGVDLPCSGSMTIDVLKLLNTLS